MTGFGSSTGREFQTDGPATEKNPSTVCDQPVSRHDKLMTTGGPYSAVERERQPLFSLPALFSNTRHNNSQHYFFRKTCVAMWPEYFSLQLFTGASGSLFWPSLQHFWDHDGPNHFYRASLNAGQSSHKKAVCRTVRLSDCRSVKRQRPAIAKVRHSELRAWIAEL